MTRFVPIDILLPDVLTFVPACPEPVAVRYLIEVAQEFCKETMIWSDTDQIAITGPYCEGVCSFPCSDIISMRDARFDGRVLEPKTTHWLDDNIQQWDDAGYLGQAQFVTQMSPNTLRVIPGETGSLTVRLTLSPSRNADVLPAFMTREYAALLTRGAAGRIMLLPNMDTADPARAQVLITEFKNELPGIKSKARKTQLGARTRTRPHYF